jgi:hypothetical protein
MPQPEQDGDFPIYYSTAKRPALAPMLGGRVMLYQCCVLELIMRCSVDLEVNKGSEHDISLRPPSPEIHLSGAILQCLSTSRVDV